MRVGVYVPNLRPEMGGGHTYEHDILDALRRVRGSARHEIVAVGKAVRAPLEWDESAYVSISANLSRRVIGKIKFAATEMVIPTSMKPSRVDRILIDAGIDLMWCVVVGTPTRRLPYVTTIWDLQHRLQPIFPEVGSGSVWTRREKAFSREIGQASVVIVGTDAGLAEVERFYGVPSSRLRRLQQPTPRDVLDRPEPTDDVLRKYRLEPGYIFYPAQFWAHKNHVVLLRVLRQLEDTHDLTPDLVFVGSDKGNEPHIRKLESDLGLVGRVHHLGFVPRDDLVALYQHALALGYVSLFGPDNLPPLEAFALGCPVVAADVPGAAEQLGDAAILVPPTDSDAIAQALLKIRNDAGLREDLVARGRRRARSFTSDDYVEGMMHIIDELAPVVGTWR